MVKAIDVVYNLFNFVDNAMDIFPHTTRSLGEAQIVRVEEVNGMPQRVFIKCHSEAVGGTLSACVDRQRYDKDGKVEVIRVHQRQPEDPLGVAKHLHDASYDRWYVRPLNPTQVGRNLRRDRNMAFLDDKN